MRKMKLDVERLAVESFAMVAEGDDARGTIHGNAVSEIVAACSFRNSCVDSCQLSCTGSCATGYNCQQVC